MGKAFDKVGISLISALLSFLLFYRLTHSVWMGALCAIFAIATFALFITRREPRAPKHLLSKRNFIRYVLLKGTPVLKERVENSFRARELSDADGHTVLVGNSRVLLYYAYKFGSLSEEDVAKSYRLAEKYGCEEIYALTNHLDRKAIAVTEYIPQRFTVVGASALYKYLLKKSLIPNREVMEKKEKKVAKVLRVAFGAGQTKYYVWAGLSTALLALFTPITTYYVVFSFINLAFAILSMIFSERTTGEDRLFKG